MSNPKILDYQVDTHRQGEEAQLINFSDITLRDLCANSALQGLIAKGGMLAVDGWSAEKNYAELARMSYAVADAMIKAREASHVE